MPEQRAEGSGSPSTRARGGLRLLAARLRAGAQATGEAEHSSQQDMFWFLKKTKMSMVDMEWSIDELVNL